MQNAIRKLAWDSLWKNIVVDGVMMIDKKSASCFKWNWHPAIDKFDLFNGRLRRRNEAKAYINNPNEAMVEYYEEFVEWRKLLPHETQLPDFYGLSEGQKNGELLFVTVNTGLATYTSYKYLK